LTERDVSGAPMLFYHDTQQYFQQAYAMNFAGAASDFGEVSPSGAGLLTLRSALSQRPHACLFTERALAEPNLELLLSGLDVRTVELDSFGQGIEPGAGLYRKLMESNFAALADCAAKPDTGTAQLRSSPAPTALGEPSERNFPPQVTPRFLLSDQYGRSVSNQDFAGRLQLVFFGFTTCPDICPTTVAQITGALGLLGEDAAQVQPLFITVDPERDTQAALAEYLGFFDQRILGLRGSPAATKRTAELFRALYRYVPSADGDGYTVDHSASIYLLGRRGEFITKFAYGMSAQEIASRLREYLD